MAVPHQLGSRALQYAPILLTIGLSLFLAASLNLWVDEAFSLHTTTGSPLSSVREALRFELQPPLYFLFLNLWRHIEPSPFFARAFSVGCAAMMLVVMLRLSRRIIPWSPPIWVAAALSINPFLIWAAVEARCYAMVLCLSALLFSSLLDAYFQPISRPAARLIHILIAVLSLYTQYYLGFVLVANFIAVLVLRTPSRARDYLIDMLMVALASIPLFCLAPSHVSSHSGPVEDSFGFLDQIKTLYWRLTHYILYDSADMPIFLGTSRRIILLTGGLLLLIGLLRRGLYPRKSSLSEATLAVFVILAVLSVFFLALSSFVGHSLTEARHTAFFFLPVSLGVLALAVHAFPKRGIIVYASIILTYNAAALLSQYTPVAKPGDWKRLASYIMASEKPNQPILVFRSQHILPLYYHYKGINVLVPLPEEFDFQRWDLQKLSLRSEAEIVEAIKRIPGRHDNFWIVTDFTDEYLGVKFHHDILEAWIQKFCTIEAEKTFYGSRARFLSLKQPL